MISIKPGTRVVRGPDWASKKQDNGEGFLGTIIFVPKAGSGDNQVTVIWDSGRELRYRAGHDGKYDLLVYDSAPAGITHDKIKCDACKDSPIKGIRWQCSNCDSVNLCSLCYMSNKHDVTHGFNRINTAADVTKASVAPVPPRDKAKTIKAKGLFPTAEVIRGPHWKWKNDDGGEGEVGRIQEVVDWDKKYHRGGVKVVWKSDPDPKTYRVGGEGCVDVIYTRMKETASGGTYFPDHLPVVDVVKPGQILLKPGDKVRVNLTLEDFKKLQNSEINRWTDNMQKCIGVLGTIVQILFQGKTCQVQYVDGTIENINEAALTRVHTFKQGDAVTVLEDYKAVKMLQEGHGGWNDDMKPALGKNGRIIKIDQDGDVRVKVEDRAWIFSPVCLNLVDNLEEAKEIPAIPAAECVEVETQSNDVAEAIAQLYVDMLRGTPGQSKEVTSIVQAAGQGDLETVKEIVKRNPSKIDQKVEGKTALQIACYEGHTEIVKLLLDNKANPNLKDSEEDSPLHYCAFGQEHKAMEELLKRPETNVDIVNKENQTSLHIAVGKKAPMCVKILMKYNANPSLKDKDGDTPMHDAITQSCAFEIISALMASSKAQFQETNSKGFNVLQWAVMKDARPAVNVIIDKKKSVVNDKMSEGFTALHIAAANDHVEIASALIHKGSCEVNARDRDGRTPLIICVSQGHKRTMEVLIAASCDVNAQDNNGNTALHVAQMKKSLPGLIQRRQEDTNVGTQIICALLEAKANIDIKNTEGKSPLDLAEDPTIRHFMKMLAEKAKVSNFQTTKRGVQLPSDWVEMGRADSFKRVPLPNSGDGMLQKEHEMVAEKFKKTLGQAKILQIERVQNPYYWECYQLKKMRLEVQYGGSGCANERELFHGTLPHLIDVICKDNLDFRLAGERVGTLFGRGTYFASDAKYSDLYSQVDKEKNKYMFLVKVLCGKVTLGDPKFNRPPSVDPNNPQSELYDCCVDNVENPRVFCVFDRNQYYPQYLIKYR